MGPIYSNNYVHKLEKAILDLLDVSEKWWEIQEGTGLSEKECKALSELYETLCEKYYSKE